MANLKKWLIRLTQGFLFAALAAPIVSFSQFILPYFSPPNFFFQICVALAAICFGILLVLDSSFRPRFDILTVAVATFLIIQTILLVISADPLRSFQGSVERMAGFWNLFHFFLFFIIAATLVRCKNKNFINQLMVFSIIVSFLVIIKFFFAYALNQTLDVGVEKFPFGNHGFLAIYLTLHIPLAISRFVNTRSRREKIAMIILVALYVLIPFIVGNRGSLLACVIGGFLLGIYFVFKSGAKKWILIFSGSIVALLMVGGGLFYLNRETPAIKNSPVLNRLISKDSISSRILLWDIAWRGFLEKPLAGWGRENFQLVYEKYYNPRLFDINVWEAWGDRAHNVVLDELIAGGLINIAALVFLFGAFAFVLILIAKQKNDEKHFAAVFAVFLVIYAAALFFTLDTVASYLPLFLAFSIIAARYSNIGESFELSKSSSVVKVVGLIVAVGISLGTFQFTIIPAIANYETMQAVRAIPANFSAFYQQMEKVDTLMLDDNPYKAELFVLIANRMWELSKTGIHGESVVLFERYLVQRFEKIIPKQPQYARFIAYYGIILNDLARQTQSGPIAKQALDFWESFIKEHPNRQQFLGFALDANLLNGNVSRAVGLARKTIELTPNNQYFRNKLNRVIEKYSQ